jgi:hypothetical protein
MLFDAVFIVIPVGIARALGTTPITLGDDDEEDENDLAEAVGVNRGDGKADGKGKMSIHIPAGVLDDGNLDEQSTWGTQARQMRCRCTC